MQQTQPTQAREQRIIALASQFVEIMRSHPDRLEVLDAMSMARILFREGSDDPADHPNLTPRAGVQQAIS